MIIFSSNSARFWRIHSYTSCASSVFTRHGQLATSHSCNLGASRDTPRVIDSQAYDEGVSGWNLVRVPSTQSLTNAKVGVMHVSVWWTESELIPIRTMAGQMYIICFPFLKISLAVSLPWTLTWIDFPRARRRLYIDNFHRPLVQILQISGLRC